MTTDSPDLTLPGSPSTGSRHVDPKESDQATSSDAIEAPFVDPDDKGSPSEIYGDRLEWLWALAHRDEASDDIELFNALRDVLLEVTDGGIVLGDDKTSDAESAAVAIRGDIDTIQLLLGSLARQLRGPADIEGHIRGQVAQTIQQLEARDEGSREQRIDILITALRQIRSLGASRLAPRLLGYLELQQDRDEGYWSTVSNLATLAIQFDERDLRPVSSFLLHHALRGVWLRVYGNASLGRAAQATVSTCAFNQAALLARWARDEAREPPQAVLATLSAIATVAERRLELRNPVIARELVEELGLAGANDLETLTTVSVLAGIPAAIGERSVDLARLEASSGVALAAGPRHDHTSSRFFNAAVSLAALPTRAEWPNVASRIILNAIGLRWALQLGDDLTDAMTTYDGIDCAVNLLGAAGQYDAMRATPQWPTLERLASLLAGLPNVQSLRRGGQRVELAFARLGGSVQTLRLNPVTTFEGKELPDPVEKCLDGFRPLLGPDSGRLEDAVLDTAAIVRRVFTALLGIKEWGLRDRVEQLATLRAEPAVALRDEYESFALPLDSPAGTGPAVGAGLMTLEEWDAVAETMLLPVDIVSLLRTFSA